MDLEYALQCVGEGWHNMLRLLFDAKPEETTVTDVKEKYGGLRFYVDTAPSWYYDLIDKYEELSLKICEKCGNPGVPKPSAGGWIKTYCDNCLQSINGDAPAR